MLIQMTATVRGVNSQGNVQRYIEGQTYDTSKDIGHSLACQFLSRNQAVQVNAPTVEEEVAKLMALLEERKA